MVPWEEVDLAPGQMQILPAGWKYCLAPSCVEVKIFSVTGRLLATCLADGEWHPIAETGIAHHYWRSDRHGSFPIHELGFTTIFLIAGGEISVSLKCEIMAPDERLTVAKACKCPMDVLMQLGCRCGGK